MIGFLSEGGTPTLRFTLTGPVQAWLRDEPVALGPPQRRAVLAMLVLAGGRVVSTDELVGGIWGDKPPPRTAAALQAHVSVLRRVLEPGRRPRGASRVLLSVGRGYALDLTGVEVDLLRFRERRDAARAARAAGDNTRAAGLLSDALRGWDGNALAGLPGPAADLQRTALQMERLGAFEELIEVRLDNEPAALPVELHEVLREHPHRERLHALCMRALRAAGRRAEALGVYAELRRRLVEDLGIEPGPEVRVVQRAILAEDELRTGELPVVAPVPAPPPAADRGPAYPARLTLVAAVHAAVGPGRGGGGPGRRPAYVPQVVPARLGGTRPVRWTHGLVGRDPALEELDGLLQPGQPQPIVVHGHAGIGTTAVAVGAVTRAQNRFPAGLRVLDGRTPFTPEPSCLLVIDGVHHESQLDTRLGVPSGAGVDLIRQLTADGATVLITGTCRLRRLMPARRVEIPLLSDEESYALLAGHLGADRVADQSAPLRELARAMLGLPVLATACAEQLVARPSWSVAEYLADLYAQDDADPRWTLDVELGPFVRHAYEAVEAAALELLGECFVTSFAQGAAEIGRSDVPLGGAAPDRPEAIRLLAVLADHHLLTEPAPGRFRMPPVVRRYIEPLISVGDLTVRTKPPRAG